jgi:hypothetical protein
MLKADEIKKALLIMDDRILEVLKESLEVQKQQSLFLRKHLLRIKYSLWTLLLLFTLSSVGLGIYAYRTAQPQLASPISIGGGTVRLAPVPANGTLLQFQQPMRPLEIHWEKSNKKEPPLR